MKFLSVFLSVLQRSSRVPRGNRKSVRKCTELFISTSHKFKLVKHLIKLEHLSHCVCRTLSTLDHPFMQISGMNFRSTSKFQSCRADTEAAGIKIDIERKIHKTEHKLTNTLLLMSIRLSVRLWHFYAFGGNWICVHFGHGNYFNRSEREHETYRFFTFPTAVEINLLN